MLGGVYKRKGRGAPYIVKFPGVHKRYHDKKQAEKFLNYLRYQHDIGTFDVRDYQVDKPLSFDALILEWAKGSKARQSHVDHAARFFGEDNIKTIEFRELDGFRKHLLKKLSTKTVHDIFQTLKQFWRYQAKADKYIDVPDFPPTPFTLQTRKVLTRDVQLAVLDEVERISQPIEPKVWVAISLLALNGNVRPTELVRAKEGDLDLKTGTITIMMDSTKTRVKDQTVILLDKHIQILKQYPPCLDPNMPIFRHHRVRKGIPPALLGKQWGVRILEKWWNKACKNLDVKGVSLYPGTKHSTANVLRHFGYTPEQIRAYLGHRTGTAFRRYYHDDPNEQLEMVRALGRKKGAPIVHHIFEDFESATN